MSIGNRFFLSGFILCLAVILPAVPAGSSTIYPHYFQNGIDCTSCHDVWSSEPKLMPPWTSEQQPQDIDDTQFNKLCWSCHNELDGRAPFVKTHSSRQADSSSRPWSTTEK